MLTNQRNFRRIGYYLLLVFWTSIFIFYIYFLATTLIEKASTAEIASSIVWISVSTFRILNAQSKISSTHLNNSDRQTETEVEVIGDRPKEKIALIALATICIVPFLFILWFNRDELLAPYVIEPEYEFYNTYATISVGLLLIVQDIENLIEVKKKAIAIILQFFTIALTIATFVMLIISTSHITEINS